MEQNTFAAIEIGETQTKIVVANYYANRLCVVASCKVKTYGIANGEIVNRKEVVNSVNQALNSIREQGYNIDKILAVLPSRKMNIYRKRSTISILSNDHIITSRDVKELVQTFSRGATPNDDVIVNVFPIQYILDDDKVVTEDPSGMSARNVKFDCFIVTLPVHIARGYVDLIHEHVEVIDTLVAPCANLHLLFERPAMDGIIIDIGGSSTSLTHIVQGNAVSSNYLRFGSNSLTDAIVKNFDIDYQSAEMLKRRYGNANFQSAENIVVYEENNLRITEKQITEAIEKRISEMLFEFNKIVKIFPLGMQLPIYLTGGGADLKGLDEQMKTIFMNGVHRYSNPYIGARTNEFVSCLGLIQYFISKHVKK